MARDKEKFKVEMNMRELDTIIAALRWWQTAHDDAFRGVEPMLIDMTQEHGPTLSVEEIDALIERVN